jgi:SAM-dependent methyltransferase
MSSLKNSNSTLNSPSSQASAPQATELVAAHPLVGRVEREGDGLRVWVRAEDLRVHRDDDGIALGALVVEHLEQWSEVYDLTYSASDHDPALDLSGWRASDTGQPFPREQMVEWAERTVELILRTRPRTVLEIGCGTGLLLHRLMPHIEGYLGLDVSGEVIARHRAANLPGAAFCHAAAHDLRTPAVQDALAKLGPVDTVVINSVTQCFGSVDYLAAVVHDAISVVRPGGAILVGDIRHSGLLKSFEQWLASASGDTARMPTRDDTELLVDPPTLAQIAAGAPRPTRLVTLPRPLSADTELSRYRFDAIFFVAANEQANDPAYGPADDIHWVQSALLTDDPSGRTPAQLHADCTETQVVVLHPDDPHLVGIASSLKAAAYTVEQVNTPARPHEPLGAFARRRLAEECRRVLRRAKLPPHKIEVQLPWSAPRSLAESTAIDTSWDASGSAQLPDRGHSRLATAVAQLNQVALQALSQFLHEHGPLSGGPASLDEVCAALHVAPRHRWVVGRWLNMLAEHGWAKQADGRFTLTGAAPRAELLPDGPLLERACARLGYPEDMAAFFRTALQMLEDLLSDRASTQSLMFPDGDLSTMLSKDQGNVGHRYIHGVLRAAVADIASGMARPLRILELGGGAGGATEAVLEGLSEAPVDYAYLFTDVSPFFLEAAQDRFSGLEVAAADINAELSAQGLAPGQDLIVAANVLHCATSVGSSLRRIRELAAPQACLVVVESVREHPIVVATMQCMLSGQNGESLVGSGDRRAGSGSVFLSSSALRAELAEAGWSIRRELPRPGSPLETLGQVLMVCTPAPTR